jgi:gas vesicle protein
MTDNRDFCFFLGVALGVTGALLFAPKSGAQTRAAIADKAKEGQDFVNRQSNEIRDAVDRGRKAAKRTADGIADAFEAGKATLVG